MSVDTPPVVQPEAQKPSPMHALGGLFRSREMPVLLALVDWGNRHLPGTLPKTRILEMLGRANPDA